jgi:hypothetical protein
LTRAVWIAALCVGAGAGAACKPDFGNPPSLVTTRRVLAVRGVPAEARPGANVAFDALVVSPDGTDLAPPLDWTLCSAPKPLDENNVVAGACLGDEAAVPAGSGATVQTTVPLDACQRFGPDPPPQMPGQPPLRPRDPDITGGYFQPVRATDGDGGITAFGLERITCNLASAGATISVEFARSYQQNSNPRLDPLALPRAVAAGSKTTFTVSWPADAVESYPVYDIVSESLVVHREAMRVSWFATDGTFEHDRTGRDEDEPETSSDDAWTAPKPAQPETVHVWVILRDSRGGVDFAATDIEVTP